MVVDMHGRRSRDIVDKAITALLNLEHRGAQGAEPHSGDGAGILIQVPDFFLRSVVDFELPEAGSYATGIAFLPQSSKEAAAACAGREVVEAEGLQVIGWRDVPTDESSLGALARDAMPTFRQSSSPAPTEYSWNVARTSSASGQTRTSAPRVRGRTAPDAKPSISQAFPVRQWSTKAC